MSWRRAVSACAWVLLACPSPLEAVKGTPSPPAAPLPTVWVDGSARSGGAGSREHPLRSLSDALALAATRPTVVKVSTGLYQGPFSIPSGTRLEGGRGVVLHADGPAAVEAAGQVELIRLTVSGGTVGLVASGEVSLEDVEVSGQRELGIRLESGTLRMRGGRIQATVSETVGLAMNGSGSATLDGVQLSGPFRRAIELRGGTFRGQFLHFLGPVTGLFVVGGRAELRASQLSGGRGPAIFVSQAASLTLREVTVLGHEYAVQSGSGAEVEISTLISVRAERAALGLVNSQARLSDLLVVQSGSFGAVQLVGSRTELDRLWAISPLSAGVAVRTGSLRARNVIISRVRADDRLGGQGVELDSTEAELSDLEVAGAEGTGLVARGSRVKLHQAILSDCLWGGVAVTNDSRAYLRSVEVRRGGQAAVSVSEGSELDADLLIAYGSPHPAVSADCAKGTKVKVRRLRGQLPTPLLPCVSVTRLDAAE
jgi:hypothetical protein